MRPIDADEIIKWADDSVSQYGSTYTNDMLNMFGLFKHIINNAPTVPLPDFKEGYKQAIIDGKTNFSRPQGKWKHFIEEDNDVECPFCGFQEDGIYYNFCPGCGADMRGEKND